MARAYIPKDSYKVLGGMIYLVDKDGNNVTVNNMTLPAEDLYGLHGARAIVLQSTRTRELLGFEANEPIRFKKPAK